MTTPNILEALNLSSYPKKEQEELLLTLGDIIFRGTLLRIIEKMSEKTRTEFAALLAKNAAPEEVEAFLKARVPGAEKATKETLTELASDLSVVGV